MQLFNFIASLLVCSTMVIAQLTAADRPTVEADADAQFTKCLEAPRSFTSTNETPAEFNQYQSNKERDCRDAGERTLANFEKLLRDQSQAETASRRKIYLDQVKAEGTAACQEQFLGFPKLTARCIEDIERLNTATETA